MTIKEAIRSIVEPLLKPSLVKCKVKSVDEEKQTCVVSPLRGGADYLDVKLTAVTSSESTKMVLIPKIGTVVLLGLADGIDTDTFIAKHGEIDSLKITAPKANVDINIDGSILINSDDNILINGGSYGGLIKIDELRTQIEKNTSLLNAIKTAFNSWVLFPGDGGSALKILSQSFTAMPTANLSNIENEKVKH